MVLPRIMSAGSADDNLPPHEGPFDEEMPLLDESFGQNLPTKEASRRLVCGGALVVTIFLLLITTVAFAALYFHLLRLDNNRLPKWPKPSISPLGKYEKAAVAADNEYCSEIGRNVLLHGGNAVDAAVAALHCIGVMDSHSAGIGGGHFMTIYNATTQECVVVDAREVAPLAATEDMYKNRWNESQFGWRAVAVPGELHGMWTAFTRFGSGKVTWASLVQPTIDLLEEGYPTSHHTANALNEQQSYIMNEPTMKGFINPETGKIYKAGEQVTTRKEFLNFMKRIGNATDPVELFYRGDIAKTMAKEFKERGGLITEEDLAKYESKVLYNEVLYTHLRNGRSVCGPPAPSGSPIAQAILNIMDGYEYNAKSFDEIATFYHHFLESSKFAYAVRSAMGDPAFITNSTELGRNVTGKEWAKQIRSKITDKAREDAYYGGAFEGAQEDHGTTSISIIDKFGNAVSVTSTINLYFGAVVASPSLGIVYNDEMDDFSCPGHPNAFGFPPSPSNYIRPGKRPMSSMSPIIVFDRDSKKKVQQLMAVGGAGGSTIISGVAGVALQALWLNANVKEAVDAPRLHNQLQPNVTDMEEHFPVEYMNNLVSRGQSFTTRSNYTCVTAVARAPDGQIYANSDFRKGAESGPAGY